MPVPTRPYTEGAVPPPVRAPSDAALAAAAMDRVRIERATVAVPR